MRLAVEATAHVLSPDESALSGADTASEGGDSESECDDNSHSEVVAIKHLGDLSNFQEHMRGFVHDFLEFMTLTEPERGTESFSIPLAGSAHACTFCMLVWLKFAAEADLDRSLRDQWLKGTLKPGENTMLAQLDLCLLRPSTAHPRWAYSEFNELSCCKENADPFKSRTFFLGSVNDRFHCMAQIFDRNKISLSMQLHAMTTDKDESLGVFWQMTSPR